MTKYYFAYANATRRLKVGAFVFAFDIIDQFGGSWRGLLTLDDPAQQEALERVASQSAVKVLTKPEYDELLKKKVILTPTLQVSRLQSLGNLNGPDAVPVVINHFTSRPIPDAIKVVPITVDEAVEIGEAPFVDPLDEKKSPERKGLKKLLNLWPTRG